MNGFLAVARRELWERRNLVLAAPILALLPPLARYVPGLTDVPEDVHRLAFKALLGFALPFALALGLGASATGEEVAGRRLGFFFSRPLGTLEIWGGKIVVALVVPVAVSVLIVGPLVLFRQGDSEMPWRGFSVLPWFAMLGFSWVLASLAHVAAGLYRTRSPWLVLDLALAGALSTALYLLVWHLIDAGAGPRHTDLGPDSPQLWVATLYLVGVCLAAGYAQVAVGRSDPRLGHRALSLTLWSGLGLGLAAAAVPSARALDPRPEDLGFRAVVPLPGGDSFLFGGMRSGGDPVLTNFVVDPVGGTARRFTSGTSAPVSSPSGRFVLFGEGVLLPRLVVVSALLGQPPVITRATLVQGSEAVPLCLSDDGLRAVVREGSEARLVDTGTGKRLGLPALESTMACTFEGRRELILYTADFPRGSVNRRLVDLETGARGERVEYAGAQGVFASRGDRVLARLRMPLSAPNAVGLFDAPSGRLLANLGVAPSLADGDPASFLPDGGVAFVSGGENPNTLKLFDANGRERLALRVVENGKAALGGVTPKGEIGIVVRSGEALQTLILDPQTGALERRIEGLWPASLALWASDPATRLRQSQERFRQGLFADAQGAIVHLDRATGKRRVLIGATGPGRTGPLP